MADKSGKGNESNKSKASSEAELRKEMLARLRQQEEKNKRTEAISSASDAAKNTAATAGRVTEAAMAATGSFAGAVTGTARFLSPLKFDLLFLLALASFYFDYSRGFQHDMNSFSIDVLVLIIFSIAGLKITGNLKSSPLPWFILETFISSIVAFFSTLPSFTNEATLTITGFLLVAPWWIIYCLALKLQGIGQSKIVDWALWISLILIGFSIFFSQSPGTSLEDYAINQKAIDSFQSFFFNFNQNIIEPAKENLKYGWCNLINDELCKQEIESTRNKDVLEKSFNLNELSGSSFSMNIAEFVEADSILLEPEQSTQIEATNSLSTPVKLSFSCGLEKRSPGIPDPLDLTMTKGILYASDGNINCKNLDISTKTNRQVDFYFNVTANDVISSGERTLLVMDETAKKAILSKYPGISETKILLASRDFGAWLKAQQSTIGSTVSRDDLVQPLTLVGGTTSITAKQSLVYGISESKKVPFALYIKNNGKGNIAKLKNVEFVVPDGLRFDEANCGLNQEELNKINWRKIPRGNFIRVASCNLEIAAGASPNTPEPKSIGVKIVYDYILSKSQTVRILREAEI